MLAGTRNEGKDKARGGVQGVKHLPVALESNVSERRYAWAAIRMAAGDAATLAVRSDEAQHTFRCDACGPVQRSPARRSCRASRASRNQAREAAGGTVD